MTAQPRGTPPALAHNLRYNKVLHEHVVTLMVRTQPVPHVPEEDRIVVTPLGQGVFDVVARDGFMEDPNVPEALTRAKEHGLDLDEGDVTYLSSGSLPNGWWSWACRSRSERRHS